jgi:hypothetical protein
MTKIEELKTITEIASENKLPYYSVRNFLYNNKHLDLQKTAITKKLIKYCPHTFIREYLKTQQAKVSVIFDTKDYTHTDKVMKIFGISQQNLKYLYNFKKLKKHIKLGVRGYFFIKSEVKEALSRTDFSKRGMLAGGKIPEDIKKYAEFHGYKMYSNKEEVVLKKNRMSILYTFINNQFEIYRDKKYLEFHGKDYFFRNYYTKVWS